MPKPARLRIPTKKYADGFSHVSVCVWRIKKAPGPSSVQDGRKGSEETDVRANERTGVRTDGLKNAHVPPLCSPRSRYRPAKYCYHSARDGESPMREHKGPPGRRAKGETDND